MTRRANDAYYTPAWQTRALLAHQEISGVVLEPCAGDFAISDVVSEHLWRKFKDCRAGETASSSMTVNDIHGRPPYAIDASTPDLYKKEEHGGVGAVDWVISNPPYQMPLCRDIVAQAVKHARIGVAMLLRLSFLEPTAKVNPRGPWLARHPPSRILVLPRYSYTQDGKSDSCTTAWMIWLNTGVVRPCGCQKDTPSIECLYNADVRYADAVSRGAAVAV